LFSLLIYVCVIKVGILDKKRVLQRKLNRIGGTADTVFKSGLNRLLKGVRLFQGLNLLFLHDNASVRYCCVIYYCTYMCAYLSICCFWLSDVPFLFLFNLNVDGVKYRKESDRKVNSIDNEYSVVMANFFSVNEMLVCYYSSLIITFVSQRFYVVNYNSTCNNYLIEPKVWNWQQLCSCTSGCPGNIVSACWW
jgi:hypothetical protein